MPTIYSPSGSTWLAGDRVRFACVYTVTKTNGGIDATISATIRVQTRYSIVDTANSWSVGGNLQSKSGSNLNLNHGGSGGTTTITSVSRTGRTSNGTVSVSISGLEIYGTISGSFTIPIGDLARQITNFAAADITQTGFRADHISSTSVGTANNLRVQYNTSQSATGASTVTRGSWADPVVTGLTPGTRYYFRMAASTSQYGWGPWTGWKSFDTLPGVFVRSGGVWRNAIPYVRHSGTWRQATRYVRHSGAWK